MSAEVLTPWPNVGPTLLSQMESHKARSCLEIKTEGACKDKELLSGTAYYALSPRNKPAASGTLSPATPIKPASCKKPAFAWPMVSPPGVRATTTSLLLLDALDSSSSPCSLEASYEGLETVGALAAAAAQEAAVAAAAFAHGRNNRETDLARMTPPPTPPTAPIAPTAAVRSERSNIAHADQALALGKSVRGSSSSVEMQTGVVHDQGKGKADLKQRCEAFESECGQVCSSVSRFQDSRRSSTSVESQTRVMHDQEKAILKRRCETLEAECSQLRLTASQSECGRQSSASADIQTEVMHEQDKAALQQRCEALEAECRQFRSTASRLERLLQLAELGRESACSELEEVRAAAAVSAAAASAAAASATAALVEEEGVGAPASCAAHDARHQHPAEPKDAAEVNVQALSRGRPLTNTISKGSIVDRRGIADITVGAVRNPSAVPPWPTHSTYSDGFEVGLAMQHESHSPWTPPSRASGLPPPPDPSWSNTIPDVIFEAAANLPLTTAKTARGAHPVGAVCNLEAFNFGRVEDKSRASGSHSFRDVVSAVAPSPQSSLNLETFNFGHVEDKSRGSGSYNFRDAVSAVAPSPQSASPSLTETLFCPAIVTTAASAGVAVGSSKCNSLTGTPRSCTKGSELSFHTALGTIPSICGGGGIGNKPSSRYSMLRICENLPRNLYESAAARSRVTFAERDGCTNVYS